MAFTKTNRRGETKSQFKKRFAAKDFVEVVQTTGECAAEGEYNVKHHGKLLAVIEALNVDDAIAEAKKMFNKEVIAVL